MACRAAPRAELHEVAGYPLDGAPVSLIHLPLHDVAGGCDAKLLSPAVACRVFYKPTFGGCRWRCEAFMRGAP